MPAKRTLGPKRAAVLAALRSGAPLAAIKRATGVSDTHVRRLARENGLKVITRPYTRRRETPPLLTTCPAPFFRRNHYAE
jgi:transposase-like protein